MTSVVAVMDVFAAACTSSSEGGSTPETAETAEASDAPATLEGSVDRRDALTGEINALLPVCETPDSDLVFGGVVGGTSAIRADGTHVYFATTSGWRRVGVGGGSAESVVDGNVGPFALTASYVVWSGAGGFPQSGIFWKPKAALSEDGGAGYSETSETRIVSGVGDDYLVVRTGDVYACTAGGTCSGPVLARAGVEGIVAVGTGFDYVAPAGSGFGVYSCAGSCASNPGVLLAEGATAHAIVSDETNIFWISQSARKVLRVKRSGGPTEDVIVNVHGAFALALDPEGRIVVATLGSGIQRGPKTGTCRAVGGNNYASIAAGPTGVFVYANGGQIRRLH